MAIFYYQKRKLYSGISRKSALLFLIFWIAIGFINLGCERDDICGENSPITPLLIITFFDDNDRIKDKEVNALKVTATDTGTILLDSETTDSIRIPLKTDAALTELQFTINTDEEIENSDVLNFQYTTEESYVSSACGFRVTYKGLTKTDPPETDDNWIKEISIQQPNVIDETVTHVFIYH